MDRESGRVERHYGRGGILASIVAALKASDKDVARLAPQDLAPVDEFHLRGREATLQLAQRAALRPGLRVLDVGCGLGGSARHLAAEHGCHVTGVDLTREYIDAARDLAERVGLQERVSFFTCSALSLPFPADAFDLVWTEHAQMNIADKPRFYGEIVRVLSPTGRLVFHDIFQGAAGPPHFPVPWAEEPSLSALAPPDVVRGIVERLGMRVLEWEDVTVPSREWVHAMLDKLAQSGPPPLGLHLLMGDTARHKLQNMARSFEENRIQVVQAVAMKG